jgi:hypothetical protein
MAVAAEKTYGKINKEVLNNRIEEVKSYAA